MLQATVGCCGGVWLGRKCTCELPQLRRAADESASFRLSVRVLSASIPALAAPGILMRQRPRVEVSLGGARKETELGEFSGGGGASSEGRWRRSTDGCAALQVGGEGGAGAAHSAAIGCPWRFGDTLTFAAHLPDLSGPGLRVRLRSQSDVRLGPLQLELARTGDLGACLVDLRQRVLPACVLERRCEAGGSTDEGCRVWESPVLVLPLAGEDGLAAHVAAVFGVTADPDALLRLASDAERPLAERVATPLRELVRDPVLRLASLANERSLQKCRSFSASSQSTERGSEDEDDHSPSAFAADALARPVSDASFCAPLPGPPGSVRAAEAAAVRTALGAAGDRPAAPGAEELRAPCPAPASVRLQTPDLEPDGWVSLQSAGGRTFWHHTSLGPAPWDAEPPGGCAKPHWNDLGELHERFRLRPSF
uniref:WW domain-containing protein n=2 Tax=Alexandrium monilatum TaxID=311494 RepID=A0A7S4Q4E2_9DINO